MGDLGKLCHKRSGDALVYKHGGSDLVYKVEAGDWVVLSFAWGADGKDLDICAYWDGESGMKVGYGYDTSTSEHVSGPYHIFYSGDITASGASEWCKIKMSPWSGGDARTFRVHFNYYGSDEEYPASTCTVIASQSGGETLFKQGQACGTAKGHKAETGDPCCVLSFDATGKMISLN